MKLVAIVGTNSDRSTNRKLLKFMAKHFSDSADIEILEIKGLPAFNEPEDKLAPAPVADFSQKIASADGVIIATPEYDHTIPAPLASALEWIAYTSRVLINKPTMIVGASLGALGTSRAQAHLRQILDAPELKARIMPGSEFLLGRVQTAFDENGDLKDQGTIDFLESCFFRFLRFATITNQLNEPEEVRFEPGTYQVTTVGHNGDLPMSVTLSEERIEAIDIDSSGETGGIADVVFTRIPSEIIEGQTLNVDAVSGASVTSNGVLDGVARAVRQAGANPDALRSRPKAPSALDKEDKTYNTELVVVGGGGAGLAAAARALQAGKQVVVVEKFPSVGGNTVRAGGPMNAPDPAWQNTFAANPGEANTLQELHDIDEATIDPEFIDDFRALKVEIEEYLKNPTYLFDSKLLYRIQTYLGGKRKDLKGNEIHGNYQLISILTERALESVRWLENIGVEFVRDEVTMPVGALWRRGHKPKVPMGVAFISVLKDFVLKNGGIILTDTQVKELLITDDIVTGVKGTGRNGQTITVNGKAVILTTGGFGANTKMLQQYNTYWSEIDDDIATSNTPAATGDGILLGQSVGADLVGMGFSQMMPVSDPVTGALFSGLQVPPANFIMVNTKGKRFVDEYGSRDQLSQAAIDNGGLFYLIADENIKETAYNTSQEKIDAQVEAGTLFRADTLEELAEQINIDPAILVETITNYNSYVDAGHDPEFDKGAFDLKVEKAPFYATPRKPAVHHTMGGLKIDTKAHVINENGKTIKGLFAAGEVAGGLHAGNRLGGNSLTDIFTFGRIATDTAIVEYLG